MKKILIILFAISAISVQAQNMVYFGKGKTIGPVSISGMTAADTTITFTLQGSEFSGKPYSIQCILTDTVETAAVGIYLKASNDGTVYTSLTDSLSFAVSTYPLGKYFTGTSFPYIYGGIYIKKNGCTDGDMKFIIIFR
jgi:hypothetical protein